MYSIIDFIICPECGCFQCAQVVLTDFYPILVHECKCCSYVVMESEWNSVFDINV